MLLPIEIAHYNHWAWRLEGDLAALFPRTRWRIAQLHELEGIPRPAGIPPWYRIIARTQDGKTFVAATVMVARLVNEGISPRLLISLGQHMEQPLKTMRAEG